MRALTTRQVLLAKHHTMDFTGRFYEAFGRPERTGVWFIWGNSGNGKSSFVMQLCKELTKFGKVAYNSLEEGMSLTMANMLKRYDMQQCGNKFLLINENMQDLSFRMDHTRGIDFYIIDSLQYTRLKRKDYMDFKLKHQNKLIIFISQARGKHPKGSVAEDIMFDASQKIYIEGFRAFSNGRFYGPTRQMDIWPQEAAKYWGENIDKDFKEIKK